MKRLITATRAALGACCLCASAAHAVTPAYVLTADQLVAGIQFANNDSATPASVTWTAPYAAHTLSASFITLLLKQAYPPAWTQKHYGSARNPLTFNSTSPSSVQYHDEIAKPASTFASRVLKVTDIQAGDILAIKYSDTAPASGHTMMADAPATLLRPSISPVVKTAAGVPLEQWELLVIDSIATPTPPALPSPHGAGDTRKSYPTPRGVGRGTLRLYADPTSKDVKGYTWSTVGPDIEYPCTMPACPKGYYDISALNPIRHLVIGRIIP